MRVPQKAKRHRWEDSWSDETGRRSDPTKETIRACAEDAKYRSASGNKKGERLLLRTCFVQLTSLTDVVKVGYSEDEIFVVLSESEQDRKRRHTLAKITETVAAYRLRQMKYLQTLEKLATYRRMNGFDRVADGEDNWFHGSRSLPLTPQEFTASLWSEVNALKDAISMPARTRPWQKTMEFVKGLKGDLPDEEFAAIKRYVERRSREAARVIVTPVSTVQHCIPPAQSQNAARCMC